jgi:hypothetical protein
MSPIYLMALRYILDPSASTPTAKIEALDMGFDRHPGLDPRSTFNLPKGGIKVDAGSGPA